MDSQAASDTYGDQDSGSVPLALLCPLTQSSLASTPLLSLESSKINNPQANKTGRASTHINMYHAAHVSLSTCLLFTVSERCTVN